MRAGSRASTLLGLTLILLSASRAHALGRNKPVTQNIVDIWQEEAGLPQNYVSALLQTRDGYIWAGTRDGLARFDGVRFVTYNDRHPDQLKESEVWALAEDALGALWIGTYGGGLTRLQAGVFTTYTTSDGLPSDLITALSCGPDGTLWIGTTAGLACRRRGRFVTYRGESDLPGGAVRALHVDRLGVLWIGTDAGLAAQSAGRFTSYTRAHPEALSGRVGAIAGDAERGLWVGLANTGGSSDGLRLLKDGKVTTFTERDGLPSPVVTGFALEADGNTWIGTLTGLCRFTNGTFESLYSEAINTGGRSALGRVSLYGVTSLLIDREGSLWLGTRFDGIARLRDALFRIVTGREDSEAGVDVRVICEDRRGGMWLGTARDLRHIVDGKATVYETRPPGSSADALAIDDTGTLWVSSPSGLSQLHAGRLQPLTIGLREKPTVSLLFRDAQGAVWIGTRTDGVYRCAGGKVSHITDRDGLLGSEVRAIGQDRQGGIWIGTRDGGVTRLLAGQSTTFGPAQGLAGPSVQALYVDGDDTVWVATRRGLSRIRAGRTSTITAREGLPANFIYQIVEDGDARLWVTHALGVSRLDKRSLNEVAEGRRTRIDAVTFGVKSGLRSTIMTVAHQPAALRAHDGRLWFASARGAAVIDPHETLHNALPPPVYIEELRVNGRARPARDGLALLPGDHDLELHYTGLSFVAPERVRFRYKLDGVDDQWIEAETRRVAYYSNLSHGAYRFRVTACNNDGVWNETGATFAFSIRPRWHEHALARALAVALVVLGALGVHRLRVTRLEARERTLQARVAERTRDLQQLTASLEERVAERTVELAWANAALSAEKERLTVTLKSIGDGVIATDTEAQVVLMNRVAEQLTGWPVAEATGRQLAEVLRMLDRETRAPLSDRAREVLAKGLAADSTAPCILLTRDGREVLVADSAAPIRDPESRVVGAVFVLRDVTERERLEEQLRHRQKLEALAIVAGGIAHDFNNLLTGIFGYVDVAHARADVPQQVRSLTHRALGVLERARALASQLLTFTRAGDPVRKPMQLAPLVRDTVGFALAGSNVSPRFQVDPDLWPCAVDSLQLSQVVDNLAINARQAMPEGGEIAIELRNVQLDANEVALLPAGPYVRLSIRDRGPGIPEAQRERIFEPFFTTKPGGSGLGLATAYSIARRHGGHIEVDSASATGAAFHVYLPATPSAPTAETEEIATAAPKRGVGRILVMDDEEYVRDVAREALNELGYDVLTAANDDEAAALTEQALRQGDPVAIAILDITIPGGLGGPSALRRLRAIEPDLRAIVSSGYSGDDIMACPGDHGFDAALLKPYTIASLATIVAQVLEARR